MKPALRNIVVDFACHRFGRAAPRVDRPPPDVGGWRAGLLTCKVGGGDDVTGRLPIW